MAHSIHAVDQEESSMSSNTNDAIAAGNSYFLHVRDDGTELRFEREPKDLQRRTHYIRIIAVDGDWITEETTLTGERPYPHGLGWEHARSHKWRRTRWLVTNK
jgi:hypothetical protein